jgi:hypothetical protein
MLVNEFRKVFIMLLKKRSVYKFIVKDDDGIPLRKFASKQEAMRFTNDHTKVVALPKQLSGYDYAMTMVGECLL